MDWAHSQDLLDIFFAEVDERGARLSEAAGALAAGTLDFSMIDDLVRDAHTIKGSSNMMGRHEVAAAAYDLERAWAHVRDEKITDSSALGYALQVLADLVVKSTRDSGYSSALAAASERLADAYGGSKVRVSVDDPVVKSAIDAGGDTLGGLLSSAETELAGSVTRVDTGNLYKLINRAVEIGIDVNALADLTHVAFEGSEPTQLLAAWRTQLERLSHDVDELQSWAVSLADVPLREAVETFPQFIRFLGRRLGKQVRLETSGTDLHVDRQIVDLLREPLRHLIVNAVDHGIESAQERSSAGKPPAGSVRLSAKINDERLKIVVSDDGRGIDWEAVEAVAIERGLPTGASELRSHLFKPGFTTLKGGNDFSGTGEGLAMVADAVDRVAGSVEMSSTKGRGTTVRIDIPVSLVLQSIVVVASGDQFFGLSEAAVVGSMKLTADRVTQGARGPEVLYQGEAIPVASFSQILGIPLVETESEALLVSTRSGLVAVSVPEIVDRRRVAVKSLGPILEGGGYITGGAFLGGGQVMIVIDHHYLGSQARLGAAEAVRKDRILVVDDSAGVRTLMAATLRGQGFEVVVTPGSREAARVMADQQFDLLVVDYSMPGSTGAELVEALRHSGVELPIVMVSGVAGDSDKERAWKAGVDAYLDKFDLRHGALVETIRRLLEESRRTASGGAS